MKIPLSYSKYNTFLSCPIKYVHQYIFKTKIEEETTYPLVLGQLTHLFINLYNIGTHTKKQIRDIKDNLEVLYKLTDLQYPALNDDKCEVKKMDITKNVDKLVEFIKGNEIVFHHAVKLFNIYLDRFFPKVNQSTKYLSETTFHNIKKINDDLSVCYYGSIDLLFFNNLDDILKYIYISDFKTGKKLHSYYYEQLYFYFYNILTYDLKSASEILNNTDDIQTISYLKDNIKDLSNVHLLLFNLRDGVHEKKVLNDVKYEYELFIENLNKNTEVDLYKLHKDRDVLQIQDIYNNYKESHKYHNVEKCKVSELSFACTYCKYKDECSYRIKKEINL